MAAIPQASLDTRCRDGELILAGGFEAMTLAPRVQAEPDKAWAGFCAAFGTSIGWWFTKPRLAVRNKATSSMPATAGAAAIAAGRFEADIVPVPTGCADVSVSRRPRRDRAQRGLRQANIEGRL